MFFRFSPFKLFLRPRQDNPAAENSLSTEADDAGIANRSQANDDSKGNLSFVSICAQKLIGLSSLSSFKVTVFTLLTLL